MQEPTKTISSIYNTWKDKDFLKSVLFGFFLLGASLFVNHHASSLATENISEPVTDIVLSNLPVLDVDGVIIFIALLLLSILTIYLITEPKKIPFTLKGVALFILIRSVFINLTHLGPFTPQLVVTANPILSLGLGNAGDLFFSGHTGLPFLAALAFWENRALRIVFLVGSFVLGLCVLLGHFHYSIDVLGAFFITYTIYTIAKKIFKKDWETFNS